MSEIPQTDMFSSAAAFSSTPMAESPGATEEEVAATTPAASSDQQDAAAGPAPLRAADPVTGHIAMADEELRSGSFARAMRTYSFALDHVNGAGRAAVEYRMALCSEVAGSFHDANNRYQKLARRFSATTWASAARLGEARCLAALGRIDSLAAGILRQALLDQTAFSPRIRGELLHVCGRAYCQSFMPDSVEHLLDDQGMIMPRWVTDPNRQLEQLPAYLKESPLPRRQSTFAILQQTDQLPDSIYLRAHTPVSDVSELLKAITTRSGFHCEISESAAAIMLGRTQQLYTDDISLSLLLDGLCAPFGLIWWHDKDGIHVRSPEESEQPVVIACRRETGARLLKNALMVAPDSAQAGYSRVSLGILQFQQQSPVEAAYTFQMQMELDPRSVIEAEASFNLGKCFLATEQLPQAREAFLRAVDSTSNQLDAQIGAYLYVGRLLIEDGMFQPAVSSLVRALALSQGTNLEPHAALLLASAYLMAGSPQGANAVLMDRREQFDPEQTGNAAAFVSSLSQFQAAVLPGPKERTGRSLVTALTRFRPELQFGAHWWYLHGKACEEIGLTQQAIESFTETVKRLPAAPLRDRAMIRLAAQFRLDDRLDEAAVLLAGVNADRDDPLGQQITMQAALVALERGENKSAVQHCRHLVSVTRDKLLQKAALQVMGKAYEMQQDHKSAVYCFAGMLPAENTQTTPSADTPSGATRSRDTRSRDTRSDNTRSDNARSDNARSGVFLSTDAPAGMAAPKRPNGPPATTAAPTSAGRVPGGPAGLPDTGRTP
ncbi:MAG: hypothetical protein RIK87_27235 [Fuerstiella sp.]